jgi:hypothetical protein
VAANSDTKTKAGFDAFEIQWDAKRELNNAQRQMVAGLEGVDVVDALLGRTLSKTEVVRALDRLGVERGGNMPHFEGKPAGYLNEVIGYKIKEILDSGGAVDLASLGKKGKSAGQSGGRGIT